VFESRGHFRGAATHDKEYRLRKIETESKFSQALTLPVIDDDCQRPGGLGATNRTRAQTELGGDSIVNDHDQPVMWDRGFHDYEMIVQTQQRGGHVLSR